MIPSSMQQEASRLSQSARLDVWEVDLTAIGGERHFFTNQHNEKGQDIVWQGRTYIAYPVTGSGFTFNGRGPANRPELHLSNLFGLLTAMVEDYDGLVGGSVIRRTLYARFLDAVNFYQGNPEADPEQEQVQHYRIEQVVNVTRDSVRVVLSAPTESDGALCPGRIMLADVCAWIYRSEECGYLGPPVADALDRPTQDPAADQCSKTRRACELRHNIDSYGGFLSINKLTQ
ncbi:phage minor tail protein L [Edwardsiella tarda]|uniref:Phage minor tail protein L n=1 Tax=Edwardsiella tarda ATCC 15947 = NBRC 105688 TaxID=667121 RepID=A0AC61TLU5_EDWTA|nr:phage minor tail protein L [Edwardsiella tarda]UAL55284.1 phage minor tail protein L [Edwardsiella tarda]UCQ01674.1 phage minor tail protein L [Edwardsiella tarda ATCC 15947 = NBRC 105688]STD29384.1 phage minor tail protein L [Edwardsiella tarda]